MSHDNQIELSWATTDELIGELLGRFDHVVFCGLLNPNGDNCEVKRRWKGNSHTCTGLAHDVALVILESFYERMESDEDDDDDDESDVVPDEDEL
jgi:hypothetical protein